MNGGVGSWYHENLVASGRAATLWALVGFVVAFAVVRFITARIRGRGQGAAAPGDPPEGHDRRRMLGDITIGGVHVHHQVWGILLVLTAGLLEFRYRPDSPGVEVLAALFGVGAALALDEFALWFYLDDVYWSDEGRRSITAVLVAGAVGAGLLLSSSPFGLEEADPNVEQSFWSASLVVVVDMTFSLLCILKGKLATGVVGVVIPFVSIVGAVRLAKPTSWWARKRYSDKTLARARRRFGPRWQARQDRIKDALSGASRSGGLAADPRTAPADGQ